MHSKQKASGGLSDSTRKQANTAEGAVSTSQSDQDWGATHTPVKKGVAVMQVDVDFLIPDQLARLKYQKYGCARGWAREKSTAWLF